MQTIIRRHFVQSEWPEALRERVAEMSPRMREAFSAVRADDFR